jgi:hypothetical protein
MDVMQRRLVLFQPLHNLVVFWMLWIDHQKWVIAQLAEVLQSLENMLRLSATFFLIGFRFQFMLNGILSL